MSATSFTTFFGNAVQGHYVTWGNTAVANAVIDGTTTLTFSVDARMYANSIGFDTGTLINSTITFYMLLLNPEDEYDFQVGLAEASPRMVHYNKFLPYDGYLASFTYTETAGTPNTFVLSDSSPRFQDVYCGSSLTAGAYLDSTCFADNTDNSIHNDDAGTAVPHTGVANGAATDWVSTNTGAEYCTEKWIVNAAETRCVRVQFSGSRAF